jgi:hypothetical protein
MFVIWYNDFVNVTIKEETDGMKDMVWKGETK